MVGCGAAAATTVSVMVELVTDCNGGLDFASGCCSSSDTMPNAVSSDTIVEIFASSYNVCFSKYSNSLSLQCNVGRRL